MLYTPTQVSMISSFVDNLLLLSKRAEPINEIGFGLSSPLRHSLCLHEYACAIFYGFPGMIFLASNQSRIFWKGSIEISPVDLSKISESTLQTPNSSSDSSSSILSKT